MVRHGVEQGAAVAEPDDRKAGWIWAGAGAVALAVGLGLLAAGRTFAAVVVLAVAAYDGYMAQSRLRRRGG